MNPHQLLPTLPRVATSAEWYAYYVANAEFQLEIPWERGAEVTKDEISAIANWRRVSLNAGGSLHWRCHMNPKRYEWKNCPLESRNTCDEICASFRD